MTNRPADLSIAQLIRRYPACSVGEAVGVIHQIAKYPGHWLERVDFLTKTGDETLSPLAESKEELRILARDSLLRHVVPKLLISIPTTSEPELLNEHKAAGIYVQFFGSTLLHNLYKGSGLEGMAHDFLVRCHRNHESIRLALHGYDGYDLAKALVQARHFQYILTQRVPEAWFELYRSLIQNGIGENVPLERHVPPFSARDLCKMLAVAGHALKYGEGHYLYHQGHTLLLLAARAGGGLPGPLMSLVRQ